jgi:hypothetical protein
LSRLKRLILSGLVFLGLFVLLAAVAEAEAVGTWVTERRCYYNVPINTCYERLNYVVRDGWTTLWIVYGQWVKVTGLA